MDSKLGFSKTTVGVVGLGYVGLPLARAFARSLEVIGFDTDRAKIKKLSKDKKHRNLLFSDNPQELGRADFIIICVPTPVTSSKEPDLSYVKSAARTVGRVMKKGSLVVLESTVYPGVTEEIVKPILERESGFRCGLDFKLAYSPERVDPGDNRHALDKITKVVSGMDRETAELVAELYRKVSLKVFVAKDIKTAEAAKVVENVQRDLNIALTNELALVFAEMGLSIRDVLDTAATKWNFHRYSPGLVGGHCIPVDPYYLVYKAKELGYHPQVILAGRAINDHMPKHVAEMTIKALNEAGKVIKGSRVLIMGLTYKQDVPGTREGPVKGVVRQLREYGVEIAGFDPLLNGAGLQDELGIRLLKDVAEIKQFRADGIIVAVAHFPFLSLTLSELKGMQNSNPVLVDVRGIFDAAEAVKAGFCYKTL
jgi:UDP-N-acetyl-D-galactosamine dehydrogenase